MGRDRRDDGVGRDGRLNHDGEDVSAYREVTRVGSPRTNW
jgi:hypothetical protein